MKRLLFIVVAVLFSALSLSAETGTTETDSPASGQMLLVAGHRHHNKHHGHRHRPQHHSSINARRCHTIGQH